MSLATIIHPIQAAAPRPEQSAGNWLAQASGCIVNTRAIGSLVIKELFRRKDFYALFILTALMTLILGSVNFFNESYVARYLKEICLFLIWVSSLVIAITTTARQIPAERESRTIFPLLAKPVTRTHVVLGKFLGCWQACGIALLVFYLFFAIVSGSREHSWPLTAYFQALVLHWFMLGVVIAMTLAGSVVFTAPSSNNTIMFVVTFGILLVARHLNKLALQMQDPLHTIVYSLYFAIPHLELFDVRDLIIHNLGTIPWAVWIGAATYALVYTAFFLAAACLVFRRKAVN